MRKILIVILIFILGYFTYKYFEAKNESRNQLLEATSLIEKEIKNVGKLVVTEGSFAQVFAYKDSKQIFNLVAANKKALVVINAKVTISYDLRALETEVDAEAKTITITKIPKPEININPDIEYYDVSQDYLNQFEASDYNTIKKRVMRSIRKKVEASELPANAQNRLVAELSNIYVVTNTLGWTLKYNTTPIENSQSLQRILD
ncbi:DUF4230 domain-containing protein [Leeuwenhoekiella marinoflava]|uniref:DUF4230 domain-containing protein n=2 Tax=Leeuwenhoekiella marinoflava TaxID=988 RepID=A0A4Q0PJ66_9FLAO|nr:DUF4230 domain-containing protein [Leeuwenhoekiella marinoflava]RXG27363.1 putative protein DUF4230 [Leeuwenhoekiella marinoflava]SHF71365.1 Protein of unknown function [Leeuwenhoekiella marinoflava DSM 3653]